MSNAAREKWSRIPILHFLAAAVEELVVDRLKIGRRSLTLEVSEHIYAAIQTNLDMVCTEESHRIWLKHRWSMWRFIRNGFNESARGVLREESTFATSLGLGISRVPAVHKMQITALRRVNYE
jgi:hypothetical protein